jgi:hypothetical protein
MLGGLLAVGLGLYFAWIAVPALSDADGALLGDAGVWGFLAITAFCYALIIPISAWAWSGLLTHYGNSPGWRTLCVVMARTQLAKYVPGNIAQHGLRLALALRAGVRPDAFSGTVVQETILAMAASLLVGVVGLTIAGRDLEDVVSRQAGYVAAFAALAAMAVVLVALRAGSRRDSPAGERAGLLERLLRYVGIIDATSVVRCLAAYCANFLLIGVGMALLARSIGMPAEAGFAAVTGAFALSWVLGFLAPGAPAGLGVREGIMVLLLAGTAPQEQLVGFVLLARVATMAGDAACFAIGWMASRDPGMTA